MSSDGHEDRVEWYGPDSLRLALPGSEPPGSEQQGPAVARMGDPIMIANEFSEVRVSKVSTRNGTRLLIEAPRSGQWVMLCPLELEALTWQATATFSAMIGTPDGSLIAEDDE